MIRHCVLLDFVDSATDEALAGIVTALSTMPERIAEIRSYSVARDLGLSGDVAKIAVVADFDSVEDYQVYASHPDHVQVITDLIKPIVAARSAAQIEI